MNITLTDIEKAHYRNQQGMFFSGMKVMSNEEAVLLYSDVINDFFWNYAALINTTEDKVEKLIQEIISFYQEKCQPAIYVTPFTKPGNMSELLESHGFTVEFKDAWMVCEKESPSIKKPNGLIVEKVRSNEDMEIFIRVFSEAYGGDGDSSEGEPYGGLPSTYKKALRLSFQNSPKETGITHYLGFLNEEPVAIASLTSSNKFGGIYNVGTIPKHRRKAIGSVVSLKVIEDSKKQGNILTYLMTEEGSHVEEFYKKLGFSTKFIGCGYVLSEKTKR